MISRTMQRQMAATFVVWLPLACVPLATSSAQETPPDARERGKTDTELVPGPATGAAIAGQWRASRLIGSTITNMLGESIGRVEDVVIDGDGKVVAVMVGVGGFLGLGETPVAIGFNHLIVSQVDADHPEIKTSLSRQAIEQAAQLGADSDRTVAP
ncbi:MAG: PRC-barrel domain-containing protein [Rhizobiales bacterium]|nr:PRC-barrel domain-containing protein [Hyphomicrobiales bacterium]